MSDAEPDTPQGPLDPHRAGGPEAQPPPGGPQRTDEPGRGAAGGGTDEPRSPDYDPDAGSDDETELHTQPEDRRRRQAENAGTSLDEPSDEVT